MPELLDYAKNDRRRRLRRCLLCGVCVLAIAVSAILSIPKYKALRERHARRAEIRDVFKKELATTEQALRKKDSREAALALLRAEFPVRSERALFWRSELEDFNHEVERLRQEMDNLNESIYRDRGQVPLARKGREPAEQLALWTDMRLATIAAIENNAARQLETRNFRLAEGLCLQILELDPMHKFRQSFWDNAPRK